MPIHSLTDTERQHRPEAIRARFRYFVAFAWKGKTLRRWFESPAKATRYIADLQQFQEVTILTRGEEQP